MKVVIEPKWCENRMLKMQSKTPCLEVFFTLMLVSFVSCGNLPCPNCTDQHIRIIKGSEECDVCWPCNLLECHEGHGSSVACGTTVRDSVHVHCISCIRGANFSDRSSSDQCQPCGVCTGNHEHVLMECTPESDIKCECDNGFFRNRTTKECLPCASCCMSDGSVKETCRGDGGDIGTKCKFKELYPPTCIFSLTTAAVTDISLPTLKASLSLVTPSSVTTSSLLYDTSTTPALDNISPITPVPSENGQIKATLATVSDHVRPSNIPGLVVGKEPHVDNLGAHWSKSLIIVISMLIFVVSVLFVCCAAFVLKHRVWQSIRVLAALSKKLIKENEATIENKNVRGSSECPGVVEPLLGDECPVNGALLPSMDIGTAGKTTELSNLCETDLPATVKLPEQTTTSAKLDMGIPSSLDLNGPTSQGQRCEKRLASEGADESEPCLEGYPTHLSTNSCEDELVIVTVDKKSASYHCPSASAVHTNDRNVTQQFTSFSSHLAEQGSGFSPNHSEWMDRSPGNRETDLREISSLSSDPPIQATGDNRDYSTHLNDVPASLIRDVSALLDEERMIAGKDYTMLASVLGMTTQHQIRRLQDLKQQSKSPSYQLLIELFASTKNSGTLKHLCFILENMERHDVIKVIDDWVSNKV